MLFKKNNPNSQMTTGDLFIDLELNSNNHIHTNDY